jgi:hypothetical protein
MFTVREVITAYLDDATAVLECKTDSNRTKKAQRDRLMVQFLRTLPEEIGLACSGTAIDPAKLNAGLLAEMVLAYHYNGKPSVKVLAPSGGLLDLVTAEGEEVEIKLSINGVCYNTPVARPSRVWLVNRDGVYSIPSEVVAIMTATKKVLPQTHTAVTAFVGVERLDALSLALGFAEM